MLLRSGKIIVITFILIYTRDLAGGFFNGAITAPVYLITPLWSVVSIKGYYKFKVESAMDNFVIVSGLSY